MAALLDLPPGVSIPPAGSASQAAVRRLQKDYTKLTQDPIDGIRALPNENNILEWHYCLKGSPDTPFAGGYYWGKVIFKENFPWSPPAITMITPNGRFATNVRLCLSISDYHPESWNPGWTVSAILIGLHSFMNENQPAAGSVSGSPQEQKNLASVSKEFNCRYREFRHFFPEFVKEWTGVLPTEDEPDVAPVMLPEHATPTGLTVPSIQNSSSRFDYAALHMAHAREMWNVAGPMMAYGNAPPMMPNYGYGIPPVGAAPGVQPAPHRLAAAAAAGAANLPHPHNYVPDMMGAQPVAIPQYRLDRTGEKAGAQKNRQKSNETDGGSAPKRARIGGNQDDAIVLD